MILVAILCGLGVGLAALAAAGMALQARRERREYEAALDAERQQWREEHPPSMWPSDRQSVSHWPVGKKR